MEINVGRSILEANEQNAAKLKQGFDAAGFLVLNIISSPGSGKTSLLERTLTDLKGKFKMAVIEGDVVTDNDARRVAATGAQAVQVNTDGGCHLDAAMVEKALDHLDLEGLDILFVENVGNLVCPAEFAVGEDFKIALLSTTEGDDKPQKYPVLFELAHVMIINKTDLLPYVDFDMDRAWAFAGKLNKDLAMFPVSCRTGDGLENWYAWLETALAKKRSA
jgi:hydrogenase nickel incorporation protein HypB